MELAVRGRFRYPDIEEETGKSPRETMEEAECQTCKERKYQDGSNDPGVSFKTPASISPERAASARARTMRWSTSSVSRPRPSAKGAQ